MLEASAVSCCTVPQITKLGEKAKGQPIRTKPGQETRPQLDSTIKNNLDVLPKKLSSDSSIAKYYNKELK